MADNGIYSDGFQDGRADLLNELADLFGESGEATDLYVRLEELLNAEGAL
jgi:hypothetical protein